MGFNSQCFVFDLLALGGFPAGLKQILEDPLVTKVLHDVCEDTSALVTQFSVHCERVFDSQIAHRMLSQRYKSSNPRNQNISLNYLLEQHLGVQNT